MSQLPEPSKHTDETGIDCLWMRGGTSKGAYFLAADLPEQEDLRNDLLLRIMGSPDARQIDGIGGGHPLTSKVAVVSPSSDPRADVDYLFLQVNPATGEISDRQNCGNILAGVGQFALERGLLPAPEGSETAVRIHMVHTDRIAVARFPVRGGRPVYSGASTIDGVPRSAAAVNLTFSEIIGSTTGSLLPTGQARETIDQIEVTCIDNGMPSVLMSAADLGLRGDESCQELEAMDSLKARIERIRMTAGARMGLGDVAAQSIPKMVLLSAARNGGSVGTRSFIPHRCHPSIGILGAATVAAGMFTDGSVGQQYRPNQGSEVRIEHPSGYLEMDVELEAGRISSVSLLRTARKLFAGEVFPWHADSQHPLAKETP